MLRSKGPRLSAGCGVQDPACPQVMVYRTGLCGEDMGWLRAWLLFGGEAGAANLGQDPIITPNTGPFQALPL